MKRLILPFLLLAVSAVHAGELKRCTDARGNPMFTDEPCQQPKKSEKVEEAAPQPLKTSQKNACAGVPGTPQSTANDPALKPLEGETQLTRFALAPGGTREVVFSSQMPQSVNFRVSANEALRCKYAQSPTAMSPDGKRWQQSYYGGQIVAPIDGVITVHLRNQAQEAIYFLVVSGGN